MTSINNMDGQTLRGDDSDTFSMLSTTTARLSMPLLLNETYDAPQAVTDPFPPFLLHCTLFAFYEGFPPHPQAFCNVGLPARYARGESSASNNRVVQSLSRHNKRLAVQIPLHYLNTDETSADVKALYFRPHPRDGAELMARQPSLRRGRMFTLFATISPELTGIVTRPLVDRALSAMFFGSGITGQMAIFPGEAVLTYGAKYRKGYKPPGGRKAEGRSNGGGALGFLKSFRSSKRSSDASKGTDAPTEASTSAVEGEGEENEEDPTSATPSHVKISMVYATLDLLPPPPHLLESKGPYPKEMNKSRSSDQDRAVQLQLEASRMSASERYAAFGWELDATGRRDMLRMLSALERRGGIWAEAGRVTMPSSRNPDPRTRARYMVKGLFPQHFVNRCEHFRTKDHQPMPSDLSPESCAKLGSPVVVHVANERLSRGAEIQDLRRSSPLATTEKEREEGMETTWHEDDLPREQEEGGGGGTASNATAMNGYGTDSRRAQALLDEEGDFFEGWSIGVTVEPFKDGGFFETLGSMSAGAYVAGAMGGW